MLGAYMHPTTLHERLKSDVIHVTFYGVIVVQWCNHIVLYLYGVRWRHSRPQNSEAHVFVNFVAV